MAKAVTDIKIKTPKNRNIVEVDVRILDFLPQGGKVKRENFECTLSGKELIVLMCCLKNDIYLMSAAAKRDKKSERYFKAYVSFMKKLLTDMSNIYNS
ncbi:MAG: hypothetical protein J5594_05745 [Elusimicrobiaceae bacterium]|nr:hypothetical protein [Elusimicrobiaceae bacterium]MBR4151736.1 hypothetical protein [Selenomonadaceae bacterium]